MTAQNNISQYSMLDLTINAARAIREKGHKNMYYRIMASEARAALRVANASRNKARRAAAMRAVNYFARMEYITREGV